MKEVINDLNYYIGHQEYVSDFIGDIELKLNYGMKYYFDMPTGSGKTTLMKKIVSSHKDKKICILANRTALEEQIKSQIGNYDYFINVNGGKTRISEYELPGNLTIMTYQRLERVYQNPVEFLNNFDIVMFEEVHYILEDSQFNPKVNISFNCMTQISNPVMIFISATGSRAFNLIELNSRINNGRNFLLKLVPANKNKGSIKSFRKIDELKKIIIKSTTKWLIFVNSKNEGKKLNSYLREQGVSCAYIDSDNVGSETYRNIVENEKFNEQVCICTSVLDNGINIKDTDVKQLVIFSDYEVQVIQMCGRKRIINEKDNFDIYLFENSISQLNQKLNQERSKFKLYNDWLDEFNKYGQISCLFGENSKMGDQYREAFYMDCTGFKFNYMGFTQIQHNCCDLTSLIHSSNIFERKVSWLNKGFLQSAIFRPTAIHRETDIGKENIIAELFKFVDIEMKKEMYENFRNIFKEIFLASYIGLTTLRQNRIPSDNVINNCFKEHNFPFKLYKLDNLNRVLKQLTI